MRFRNTSRSAAALPFAMLVATTAVARAQATPTPTDQPSPAAAPANTDSRPYISLWRDRLGLDLTLIQPGSFFYIDTGVDDAGEVDIFKDGKLAVTVQLAGLDLGMRVRNNALRFGFNGGVGVTSATVAADGAREARTGGALVYSGAFFLQFRDLMRFEAGAVQGRSGVEGLTRSQQTDGGRYFGISLNTKLGDALENIIR
jgi:hypothetical protein